MWLAGVLACSRPAPLPEIAELPAFHLTDQTGQAVGLDTFAGSVLVVNFIFTRCPNVCPLLSAEMSEAHDRYAADDRVRFMSVTVDPEYDTPDVLAAYAARFGADPKRWRFVTGDAASVRAVVVDGFKSMLEALPATPTAPVNVLHGERFVLVDQGGTIRAYPDPKDDAAMYEAIDALVAAGGR